MPTSRPADVELLRGTLDLLVLKTLSWGPAHGLGVLRWIEQATGNRLSIEEGALYPALHRMEQKGWLEAEWRVSDQNRKAKYYRLSRAGKKQLVTERLKWSEYAAVIEMVMVMEGAP